MGVRRNYAREPGCTALIVLDCDRNTGVSDKQLLSPLVIWEVGFVHLSPVLCLGTEVIHFMYHQV